MNAKFQRIARRAKKAFLSDQCKETEENNRMGKTRDLFKKIRDTKGTFHAKMGLIKKGMTEDEMVGWHHRLNGHGLGWTPGVGDGQPGVLQFTGLQRVGHD